MKPEYKAKLDERYGKICYRIVHEWDQDDTVFVITSNMTTGAGKFAREERFYYRIFPIDGVLHITQDHREMM